MKLDLTPNEQADLIWGGGDWFQVVYGVVTVTSTGAAKTPGHNTIVFFFDDKETGEWGSQEWRMQFAGSIPNGPALFLLYRRGNSAKADPFGIISLSNRAWTQFAPLEKLSFYRSSLRYHGMIMKSVVRLIFGWLICAGALYGIFQIFTGPNQRVLSGAVGGTLVVTFFIGTGLLFIATFMVGIPYLLDHSELLYSGNKKRMRAINQTARSLMHRISHSTEDFAPKHSCQTDGRL